MSGTCASCAWFDAEARKDDYGVCDLASDAYFVPESKAIVRPLSAGAKLITPPDFACNQHEPKGRES
jgi:hypothetical protein